MERKSRWQMFVSEFTFFEICHTARGSQVRPPCVTFESMSHDSMSHTTKYYSINYFRNWTFPRCTTGGKMRSTAVIQSQMNKMIHEIPESCWNRNLISVPNQFHHLSGNRNSELKIFKISHWLDEMPKLADTGWKWPTPLKTANRKKYGQCSILMFYLEFRVRKLNLQTKRISNGAKLFQVADLVTEEIEGTQEY